MCTSSFNAFASKNLTPAALLADATATRSAHRIIFKVMFGCDILKRCLVVKEFFLVLPFCHVFTF